MSAMKRRRSFGSIANLGKDVDGLTRWRLRWRESGKRRTEIVRGSRRDAEHRLAEIHLRVGSDRESGVTVGWVFENLYIPDMERTKAPRTRENAISAWRTHVAPRWADVPVVAVKAGDVEDWLQTMSHGPARVSLTILRWVMRKAVLRGDVAASPLEMPLSLPSRTVRRHDREIIRSGSIADYAAAVRGSTFEAAFLLGACAGLRPGEMLGVRVGEVEMREVDGVRLALVPVRRQAGAGGGVVEDDREGMERERVKTPTSRRWAVVREPYASRLIQLQDAASRRGDIYLTDDGFGNPIGTDAMRYGLRAMYEASGLRPVLPRNLRPTFATDAHHAYGIASEDVARLMGHSRPVITWAVYERPDADAIAAAVARALAEQGHMGDTSR